MSDPSASTPGTSASASLVVPDGYFDPSECFLCCESTSMRGELVSNVCKCRSLSMHLRCQQRMLEASYARGGPLLRCGVCNEVYTNAAAQPVWRLSLTGVLWCMCPVGVIVMVWSASTVLDRGAVGDPRLSYASAAWWRYQFEYLTWWRLVGILYLAIALGMAVISAAWLVIDLCARRSARHVFGGFALPEPLCVRRRIIFCFDPRCGGPAAPLVLWRRWSAAVLPCADATGMISHAEDRHGPTVLL